MSRFVLTLILVLLAGTLPAQQKKVSSSASGKLEKVMEAFNNLDLDRARELADQLVRQHPDWAEAWNAYAGVYQESGDFAKSEIALKRLIALDSISYPFAYRWLSEWSFKRGAYGEASVWFTRFEKLKRNTSTLSFQEKLLQESLHFAIAHSSHPIENKPVPLLGLVNTSDDEYFPSLSLDGSLLVFTRQSGANSSNTGKVHEDLYYSMRQDSVYLSPVRFDYPINTSGNEGTQSLRQDGRIMFLTACSRQDTKGGCDIYYCVRNGEAWSEPINAGYPVNSRYWESTPFLSQDGNRLFFSSNRPGGFGGMDIWQSSLNQDRSWSAPVNMGSSVNTPLDELSPVLLVDGVTFFFASNGHPGLGSLDLFITTLNNSGKPDKPTNLGFGTNTHFDEFGLTVNATDNLGLFASNRDSMRGRDIYQLDMKRFIPTRSVLTLTGKVTDRITGLPLGAVIEVQPHGDSVYSRVEADPVTGTFLLGIAIMPDYRFSVTYSGYLPYSYFLINDSIGKPGTIVHNVFLEPYREGASVVLENIFFSLNSADLLPGSDQDLNEIITLFGQYPYMVIELSGYTDNTGTEVYNLSLSQKRAESVREFLVNRGIDSAQIIARGYGQTNPIASNENEAGRRLNRRTEMKIIRLK